MPQTGSAWVHLRLYRACGLVGYCNSSPNRHCWLDLADSATPQLGPIPRYVSDWNCETLEMNVPHLSDLRAANAKYDFGTFSAGM